MDINKPFFIFEMANNHQGSVETGKAIIDQCAEVAQKYDIDAGVKFQYRDVSQFIGKSKYVQRFKDTELYWDELYFLTVDVKEAGLKVVITPFDLTALEMAVCHEVDILKNASCNANNWILLEAMAETGKPMICSTGGHDIDEIDDLYWFLKHRNVEFALMHCVGLYPTPIEHVNANFVDKMRRRYPDIEIGYSGHETNKDMAVVVPFMVKANCSIFERHVCFKDCNNYSLEMEDIYWWIDKTLESYIICGAQYKLSLEQEKEKMQEIQEGVYGKQKQPKIDDNVKHIRKIVHKAKGMLNEAGVFIGDSYTMEISHHYGLELFYKVGCIIFNIINRNYCKKVIVLFPGQKHPTHYHDVKEETFQILAGSLDMCSEILNPGDIKLIRTNELHSLYSRDGCIFEEISTTHIKDDSYYIDADIKSDSLERKTIINDKLS